MEVLRSVEIFDLTDFFLSYFTICAPILAASYSCRPLRILCYSYIAFSTFSVTRFTIIFRSFATFSTFRSAAMSSSSPLCPPFLIFILAPFPRCSSFLPFLYFFFSFFLSTGASERGYRLLAEQYTAAWEEACKHRMFLPSRGEGGSGAYGICENKYEVSGSLDANTHEGILV